MAAEIGGQGDLGATISARFAGTGRTVIADAIFGEVDVWSKSDDLSRGTLLPQVKEAIRQRQTVSATSLICYRGRSWANLEGAPTSSEMGPPCSDGARANRYNAAGAPALYLCTLRAAIGRELGGCSDIWVQEFCVPVGTMKIADLSSPESDGDQLLAAVMWFAELSGIERYPSQTFSRFIASLIAEHFDGMLVSGVRGEDELRYDNLVIFNPGTVWREWLSSDGPTQL